MEALDTDIDRALASGSLSPPGVVGLPFSLGLSKSPSATWSDFIQLPPNRDLPEWINESADSRDPLLSGDVVEAFSRAHHLAAGWGLVADRIEDGQVSPRPEFLGPRSALLTAWREALGEACRDHRIANVFIDDALSAWEMGTRIERSFFDGKRGLERAGEYARSIRLRLRWVSASACAMLACAGQQPRIPPFREAHEIFMCGLQCRDDAFDADDDRGTRGAAVHEVLGVPRGGLIRAAPRVLRRASRVAEGSAFHKLAVWVAAFAEEVDVRSNQEDHLQSEMSGVILASAICDAKATRDISRLGATGARHHQEER